LNSLAIKASDAKLVMVVATLQAYLATGQVTKAGLLQPVNAVVNAARAADAQPMAKAS